MSAKSIEPLSFMDFLESPEGLMVLLREGLVKIDASGAPFAPLDGHRDVDASTGTALLDGFLE